MKDAMLLLSPIAVITSQTWNEGTERTTASKIYPEFNPAKCFVYLHHNKYV